MLPIISAAAHGSYRYDYRGDSLSMRHATEFVTDRHEFGDFVSGHFTLASPLQANIPYSGATDEGLITDDIQTFYFTDGVSIFTETTVTNFVMRVGTNTNGDLDKWEIFLERDEFDGPPEFVGDADRQIYVERDNNIVGVTSVGVFECTLVVSDFCTRFDSSSASSIGPGSFTGPIRDPSYVPIGGGGMLFVCALMTITMDTKRLFRILPNRLWLTRRKTI